MELISAVFRLIRGMVLFPIVFALSSHTLAAAAVRAITAYNPDATWSKVVPTK